MATPNVIAGAPLGTQFIGPIRLRRQQSEDPVNAFPTLCQIGPWFTTNLTTNQTAKAFNVGGSVVTGGTTQTTMPQPGSLLGLSIDLSAAVGAGNYGIRVQKNGTTVGGIFDLSAQTAQTLTRFTDNMTSVTFVRGDRFKVLAKSATNLTAGLDFAVALYTAS